MKLYYGILAGVWILSLLLMILIPKDRRRMAVLAFLFKQTITYLLGLVAVELGLLAYPVRELADINRTSFTYEFMAYPMVCAIFNVYYPNGKSLWRQVIYYAGFCTILTVPEILLERYTPLVQYIHWNWPVTWLSLLVTFFMTRTFCVLFFRSLYKNSAEPQ